ncbi:MAG: hypothetical protein ACJ74Q_04020 [Pyrinomonadaceae bacterium]
MSTGPKKIRIFASSPGDVKLEREQLSKVVNDLNATISAVAPEKKITLELLRWETHVAPGLHPDGPQGPISEQIKDYEIFVGIMWQRFGTPALGLGSGTEVEFRDAYRRWRETGTTPRIMFYFCEADLKFPDDPDEISQLQKVLTFRKEVSERGLTRAYADRSGFADLVRHDLNLVLAPMFGERKTVAEVAERVGNVALTNDDSVRAQIMELAEEYVRTRAGMKSGNERTRRMEVIITQMRTLAFNAYSLLSELTQSRPMNHGGDPRAGQRLAAVALLQAIPNPQYIEWLAARLGEERPFLGYHAAVALQVAARTIKSDHKERLRAAITSAMNSITYAPYDTDRKTVLRNALKELDRRVLPG